MATQKRGRACVACASIKIKCQLGSDTSLEPPCDRCLRLNKECVLSAPKRQKDRVAELEAQVAALTRLLQQSGIEDPNALATVYHHDSSVTTPQHSSVVGDASGNARKRRLLDESPTSSSLEYVSGTPLSSRGGETHELSKLDKIVPLDLQALVLERYLNDIVPIFPLVPIPGAQTLESLRSERPILLQAIIYAASPGVLSLDMQEDVARMFLNRLSGTTYDQGEKSLELVQAIQITCLWYRAPKHHKHIAAYQLISLASNLAEDIGITGPFTSPEVRYSAKGEDIEAVDALRAWLGCYHLSAVMGSLMRATALPAWYHEEPSNPFMSKLMRNGEKGTPASNWSSQHDNCLLFMEYAPTSLPSDRWVGQYFRAEKVCDDVIEQMELSNLASYYDVSTVGMKIKIQACKNQILNWKIKIPQALRVPALLIWEHVATAYMYEAVLHTPTNQRSFAAPFVAENLSCSDFPAPVVTQDHITAVYELLSALHAIIDISTSFDAPTTIALPGLLYASRAAYANYVLAKLYIAVTAPGNTLGSILEPSTLRAEEYCDKMINLGTGVKAIDERCAPARMLIAATRMKEWYSLYNASILPPSSDGIPMDPNTVSAPLDNMLGNGATSQNLSDWTFQFSDNAADFGLDILFAEPLPFDSSMYPLAFEATR